MSRSPNALRERDFQVYDSLKRVTVDVIERHSGGSRLVATGVTQDDAEYIVLLAKAGPKLVAALEGVLGDLYISYADSEAKGSCPFEERDSVMEARAALAEARGEVA